MNFNMFKRHFWHVKLSGKKSTVSEIRCALILWMYTLWHLSCSMAGLMYQPRSPCGAYHFLSFRILWITTLFPGGDSSVWL